MIIKELAVCFVRGFLARFIKDIRKWLYFLCADFLRGTITVKTDRGSTVDNRFFFRQKGKHYGVEAATNSGAPALETVEAVGAGIKAEIAVRQVRRLS